MENCKKVGKIFRVVPMSLVAGLILSDLAGMTSVTVGDTTRILSVPYIHQTYDTLDDFVGSWACAPTSAVMILAYYGRVPKDPMWVSYPSPHYSDYGRYISEEYTYGTYMFSNSHSQYTYWVDTYGNTHGCGWATGKGAWGFIWKDSSSSCIACGIRTNLQTYLELHDFDVSFIAHPTETQAKEIVQQEIDNGRPLIGRTYLTSGGHYVVIVGYEIDGYGNFWYKVNDPFGDKSYGSGCWGDYGVQQPVSYSYSQMKLGDCADSNCRGLIAISGETLSVSLTADPSTGTAPLTTTLTADVSGTASGTINYTFWWDCSDPGTSVDEVVAICGSIPTPKSGTCTENENGTKCDAVTDDPKIVSHVYSSTGTYTGKVIAERGSVSPAEDRVSITATIPGDLNGDCVVNIFDLVIVGRSFGLSPGDPGYDPRADADNSGGEIDISDLIIVGSHFGDTC